LKGLVRHKELINEINSPRIPHVQNLCISVFDMAILLQKQNLNAYCFKNRTRCSMHGIFLVIIKHNWPQNITELLDIHYVNIAIATSPFCFLYVSICWC
jgi:hypothetical protein